MKHFFKGKKKKKKKTPEKICSSVSEQEKLHRNNMGEIAGIGLIRYFSRITLKTLAD